MKGVKHLSHQLRLLYLLIAWLSSAYPFCCRKPCSKNSKCIQIVSTSWRYRAFLLQQIKHNLQSSLSHWFWETGHNVSYCRCLILLCCWILDSKVKFSKTDIVAKTLWTCRWSHGRVCKATPWINNMQTASLLAPSSHQEIGHKFCHSPEWFVCAITIDFYGL